MDFTLQSIVMPLDPKHELCRELFFRAGGAVIDRTDRKMLLAANSGYDFCTYFNGCSYEKWKHYTYVGQVSLRLRIRGKGFVRFVGYAYPLRQVERYEFGELYFDSSTAETIVYDFPDTQAVMIGFEINTFSECELEGGEYFTVLDDSLVADRVLCIATTTFKKEEYIKKNIGIIRDELMTLDEIRDNLYVHVVDNGRTLSDADIYGHHIMLHPNKNVGGSGGYARGMIEAMTQEPRADYCLLMDDDIQILPESILRTYRIIRILKPEFREYFIGGAMLYYEKPYKQHEDTGFVRSDGIFESVKDKLDHRKLENNLENEAAYIRQKNEYSAWWYCAIPASVIEKNGYPLPIFVRCDDIEYSLRAHSERINMNGICVWHMGFSQKFNYATDLYQQNRNLLIAKSCSDILGSVNTLRFFKDTFRTMLLRFDYQAAEVVLMAMEDYLQGPEFLMQHQGDDIMARNAKLNNRLQPLDEVAFGRVYDPERSYIDPPRKAFDTFLRRFTFNGHRFWPSFMLRHDLPVVPLDRYHPAQKITLQEAVILVNAYSQEGIVLKMDRKKYREIKARYRRVMRRYRQEKDKVVRQYREAFPYLTSRDFWVHCLGMES